MHVLYSKLGIKYQQAYSGPYKKLDFAVDGAKMVVASKDGMLSGYGRGAVATGDTRKLMKPFRKLYTASNGIHYIDWMDGGLTEISRYLLKHKVEPTLKYEQLICLDSATLYSDIRKSFKSLVKKRHPVDCPVDDLHGIHVMEAGRETRSQETWDIQQEMLDKGQAFCLRTDLAAALFLYNEEVCYYGVAASQEDSHPILWSAIQRAQALGCKWFSLGDQVFTDDKAGNIAKFKRGFGGRTFPYLEFKKEKKWN